MVFAHRHIRKVEVLQIQGRRLGAQAQRRVGVAAPHVDIAGGRKGGGDVAAGRELGDGAGFGGEGY